MDFSVRAKEPGIYKDRRMDAGDIFLVEEKMFTPTWMEKCEVPAAPEPVIPKPALSEKRAEPRDPGEHDQHLAEEAGYVPEIHGGTK